tara:strand:+ start:49 stop:252 length:204 start_codon:yes stop_codon:yes gene_type:complete
MSKEKSLFELKSVGSYLDYESGVIYPMNVDGSADRECGISLVEDEVSLDWWEALSSEDMFMCKKFNN